MFARVKARPHLHKQKIAGECGVLVERAGPWGFVVLPQAPPNPLAAQTPTSLWWRKNRQRYAVLLDDLELSTKLC